MDSHLRLFSEDDVDDLPVQKQLKLRLESNLEQDDSFLESLGEEVFSISFSSNMVPFMCRLVVSRPRSESLKPYIQGFTTHIRHTYMSIAHFENPWRVVGRRMKEFNLLCQEFLDGLTSPLSLVSVYLCSGNAKIGRLQCRLGLDDHGVLEDTPDMVQVLRDQDSDSLIIPRGLVNMGASDYTNSTVQALVVTLEPAILIESRQAGPKSGTVLGKFLSLAELILDGDRNSITMRPDDYLVGFM